MKKVILFFVFVFLISANCFAANFMPNKRVHIFYKVPDTILLCQNSKEDLTKGREEFENEVKQAYGKRFIVVGIEPTTVPKTAAEYLAMVKPNENPLILTIELKGQRTISQEYQNVFGAKKVGYAPAVDMTIDERIAYDCQEFHGYGPISVWWSPGTIALGGDIYTQTNARKNTKNAIKWLLQNTCQMNKTINKYAEAEKYKEEEARFKGDFLYWVTHPTPEKYKKLVSEPR